MTAESPTAAEHGDQPFELANASSPTGDVRRWLARTRFICTYFSQLEIEYQALCGAEYRDRTSRQVEALRAQHARRPNWATNHRFEYVVMDGLPAAILGQRIEIYRDRLNRLLGAERVPAVEQSFQLPKDAPLEAQRTVALGMLSEIQRLRHVRSEFERLRNRLLVSLLLAGALFGGFIAYVLMHNWGPPIVHVIAAGLLGGYFSVLLKLGALRWCLDYNTNYHQVDRLFWNLICSLALSMFEGAVGAIVLFTIFLAGLLTGSLFPEFPVGVWDGVDLSKLWWMVPSDADEAAKLIVWCLLAGFSERLIPDFLSGLTQQLDRRAAPAAASGPAPNVDAASSNTPPG
jgi:hypothetical protein